MNVIKKSEKVFLALWFTASVIVVSFLMSTHMAVFRAGDPLGFGGKLEAGKTYFLHILYAGCGCSREVAERLGKLTPAADEVHKVLWIDDDKTPLPKFAEGVVFNRVGADDPTLDQVTGAPQLMVYQGAKVIYQGGYTDTKTNFLSHWIVDEIRTNRTPASLPIKGCYIPKSTASFVSKIWKTIL